MKLKKVFALVLAAVSAFSLAACSSSAPAADGGKSGAVQPASNFVDCDTLEEAIETSGIDITVPEAIKGYKDCAFRANKTDGLIEVIFQSGDKEIRFRKGLGDKDISGNYNQFAENSTVDLNGIAVQMKGADSKVNLSAWSTGGYSYSIDSTEAMDKTAMTDLIMNICDDGSVQPASPFKPCDTLDAAEQLAGFDLTLPKAADGLEAIENEMIQAFYGRDGSDMLIRKALGSGDISGDYNEYAQVDTVDGVTLKGEDGQVSLALWTDGDYTYSIRVGTALSQADMMALVNGVK